MRGTLTLLILFTLFSYNTSAQEFSYIILEGHTESVSFVAFSPDGRHVATASRLENMTSTVH